MNDKKIEIIKKMIVYRCSYTGIKETDLIYRKFLLKQIDKFNYNDLLIIKEIFELLPDSIIFSILTKQMKPDEKYKEIFNKILNENR
tara:strand:+ start:404 stop:664 length:261 start_codon:yes stop_codon:yes gene_type:complete